MESLAASPGLPAVTGHHPLRRRLVHRAAPADARLREPAATSSHDDLADALRAEEESRLGQLTRLEAVVATPRPGTAAGEPLLYWAVREDAAADVGDLR